MRLSGLYKISLKSRLKPNLKSLWTVSNLVMIHIESKLFLYGYAVLHDGSHETGLNNCYYVGGHAIWKHGLNWCQIWYEYTCYQKCACSACMVNSFNWKEIYNFELVFWEKLWQCLDGKPPWWLGMLTMMYLQRHTRRNVVAWCWPVWHWQLFRLSVASWVRKWCSFRNESLSRSHIGNWFI